MRVVAVLGAGLVVLASCSGTSSSPDPSPSPSPSPSPAPTSVTKSAGDAQIAIPGGAVSVPPTVLVADQSGNPLAGVRVDFAVTGGGGAAWCAPATTDAAGKASCASWTVGKAPGAHTLSATVSGLPPAVFTASVRAEVLVDLGHGAEISRLDLAGTRLLSLDAALHWVLWDATAGSPIASGDVPCVKSAGDPLAVGLAGSSALIATPCGFEVRDAADGRVVSRVLGGYAWTSLSADGGSVYAGTAGALSAWGRDGALRFSRSGDYSQAKIFADAAALRVAGGPAGANVIEAIDPVTGTSSVGPAFQGTFHSWFADGQRFLSHTSTTVWVYTSAATQEAILSLPTLENLAGRGAWLWTYDASAPGYPLNVYKIDGAGAPAATFPLGVNASVFPGGDSLGVAFHGEPKVAIVDLSGATPTRTDHALPVAYPSSLALTSSARWFAGNSHGVILDGASLSGTPRSLGLGQAWSVAGGGSRVALATASGRTLYFDAAAGTKEGEIAFPSSKLQLSSDGAVLAAAANANDAQYMTDRTLKIFSLPAGTETRSVPYAFDAFPTLWDFSLSASGTQLGEVLATHDAAGWTCERRVSPVAGGAPTWTHEASACPGAPILLSAAGDRVAYSVGPADQASVTNIYQNGVLATAVPGRAVGWIDDGRLLVDLFTEGLRGAPVYSGAELRDPAGTLLGAPALTSPLGGFQTVNATSVYAPDSNTIFSLETGAALWSGPAARGGAVAGGRAVYALGALVLSERY